MKKFIKTISLIMIIFSITGINNHCFSSSSPIKAEDYPSLSEKEMGHLQYILMLAYQLPGDWSFMGGKEEGQEGLEGYRYQLGYMTYALALAHYHKTPAYRDLYQQAIDNLIQKMVRRDVWSYWEHTSKGGKKTNPAHKEEGLGWIYPVVEKNIMYSGHLINMVELYHMLFRDAKYDQPESIKFKWEWVFELLDMYHYDGNKLAKTIHRQFMDNPTHLIECELNLVFPVCNQHPLLGLILYDYNHGTDLSAPVKRLMMETFTETKLLDPVTHDFADFYMLEQKSTIQSNSPGNNACVGILMNAWKPDLIKTFYQDHVKKVEWFDDGTAKIAPDQAVGVAATPAFAGYAKEVGDEKTANGMTAWMEKNCSPRWLGNKYYYPRNDEMKISPLFTIMAAITELDVKDGIWAMYNRPWNKDFFKQPFISDVEYPNAVVKQAYYDKSKDVLVVTLLPGERSLKSTSFAVHQLDQSKTYSIRKNGELIGRLEKGAFEPNIVSI